MTALLSHKDRQYSAGPLFRVPLQRLDQIRLSRVERSRPLEKCTGNRQTTPLLESSLSLEKQLLYRREFQQYVQQFVPSSDFAVTRNRRYRLMIGDFLYTLIVTRSRFRDSSKERAERGRKAMLWTLVVLVLLASTFYFLAVIFSNKRSRIMPFSPLEID